MKNGAMDRKSFLKTFGKAGMSPTYCLCSVGYVKEMHELRFGRKAEVELLDSVLMGGKRCRFKITVA